MLGCLLMCLSCGGVQDIADTLRSQEQGILAIALDPIQVGSPREHIDFQPWSALAHDARVVVESQDGVRNAVIGSLRQWRGVLDDGCVVLTVDNSRVRGFTLRGGVLRPVRLEGNHLLEESAVQLQELRQPCSGLAAPEPPMRAVGSDRSNRSACGSLRVAFDSDWEFTNDLFGGDADDAAAYIVELSGAISVIQEAELGLPLEVTYVRTWSDATDPYDPSEPTDDLLDQFRMEWEANEPESDRHVAHLLSGSSQPASAGLGWRGSACSAWGYAYSSSMNGFFVDPPPNHSWSTWDVIIVAHETGHTIGARHTHEMVPPVDGCGNGDCSSAWGGTIMSYCHTCPPSYMSNTVLEFHPRVEIDIDTFLSQVNPAVCDLGLPHSTDVDGSGSVNAIDLGRVMAQFGLCTGCDCSEDVDGSGGVDVLDLLQVLQDWG
ncbi:MAG: hypothetical protein HN811_07130 [Phycisphaerae bacterium]|nr:hypothetical protein [Phycisphaerae bacterium]